MGGPAVRLSQIQPSGKWSIQNPTDLGYGRFKFPVQFKNGDEIVLNSVGAFSNLRFEIPDLFVSLGRHPKTLTVLLTFSHYE